MHRDVVTTVTHPMIVTIEPTTEIVGPHSEINKKKF